MILVSFCCVMERCESFCCVIERFCVVLLRPASIGGRVAALCIDLGSFCCVLHLFDLGSFCSVMHQLLWNRFCCVPHRLGSVFAAFRKDLVKFLLSSERIWCSFCCVSQRFGAFFCCVPQRFGVVFAAIRNDLEPSFAPFRTI